MSSRTRAAARAAKLLALARHPKTPADEARSALRMGRALMLRHGLADSDLVGYQPAKRRPAAPPTPVQPYPIRRYREDGGISIKYTVVGLDLDDLFRTGTS